MQIRDIKTPNHNYNSFNMLEMVKIHQIDTTFAFVDNLVQKLQPKPLGCSHIGFGRCGDPKGRRLGRPS